jgi:hypothetical protein
VIIIISKDHRLGVEWGLRISYPLVRSLAQTDRPCVTHAAAGPGLGLHILHTCTFLLFSS